MNSEMEALHEEARKISDAASIPKDLMPQVKQKLTDNPEKSWDQVVAELAASDDDSTQDGVSMNT
jgi:hypothetical protein